MTASFALSFRTYPGRGGSAPSSRHGGLLGDRSIDTPVPKVNAAGGSRRDLIVVRDDDQRDATPGPQ
jgi:hypothetical protein